MHYIWTEKVCNTLCTSMLSFQLKRYSRFQWSFRANLSQYIKPSLEETGMSLSSKSSDGVFDVDRESHVSVKKLLFSIQKSSWIGIWSQSAYLTIKYQNNYLLLSAIWRNMFSVKTALGSNVNYLSWMLQPWTKSAPPILFVRGEKHF